MKKIALLLILLVACQFVPKAKTPQPPEIAIGTSALEAEFLPNSISNILMCQQSDFFVSMRNLGAYDIKDGTIAFISAEQFLRPLSAKQQKFSLEGKSQFNPAGGLDQVEFRLQNTALPEQLESFSTPLIFQACYKYRTIASAPVCIDPDIRNLNSRKPCRAQPVSFSGGQGGPVTVSRVETVMVPEGDQVRPMFKISLQHVGTGRVVTEAGADAACGVELKEGAPLASKVSIQAEIQGAKLSCTPNPVPLDFNTATQAICTSEELMYGTSQGTFSSILSIDLKYGYISTAVIPITITRVPGQQGCS